MSDLSKRIVEIAGEIDYGDASRGDDSSHVAKSIACNIARLEARIAALEAAQGNGKEGRAGVDQRGSSHATPVVPEASADQRAPSPAPSADTATLDALAATLGREAALLEECDALRAKLAAAEEDVARMDWIGANDARIVCEGDGWVAWEYGNSLQRKIRPTLRAAIDAARKR